MTFRETFTRDEQKEEVEYDDSAFFTFAATLLIVVIIPLFYSIFKRIFFTKELKNSNDYKNCGCSLCKDKLEKFYKNKSANNYNFTFFLMIIILIVLSYLLELSYIEIKNSEGKLKSFNPFEILEIEPEATEREIKKAYRSQSLKYHPDRNKNPDAKAKFIMITKAYEVFTK